MKLPTTVGSKHESILRAYNILEKVKYYLANNMPGNFVLELIREMESKEETSCTYTYASGWDIIKSTDKKKKKNVKDKNR